MKIVLIAPSIRASMSDGLDDGAPKDISMNFGAFPHLGICYLAAALKREGAEVVIIDANAAPMTPASVAGKVRDIAPDVVGISSMTFTFLQALSLAREIKRQCAVPIVFGGVHVSIYPEEVLGHACVDVGVIGEGEETFTELVRVLAAARGAALPAALAAVRGIVYRRDGAAVRTPPREFIADVDTILPPDTGLLDLSAYHRCNFHPPFMTVMTSRGCPARCSFCSKVPWGRSYRCHSPARVADEVEYLVREKGVRSIDFFDDTFTADRDRVREILRLFRERRLDFEFGIVTRVNCVDEPLLRDLARAGCRTIGFGVESGDPAILAAVNKDITIAQVRDAFRWTRQAGMNTVGFFLVGNPGETEASIQRTIRLIRDIAPSYFIANVLIPYPGSALYENLRARGVLRDDHWRRVTIDGAPGVTPVANDTIPRERLIALRNRINRMPYTRFTLAGTVAKLRNIRSFHDIVRPFKTIVAASLDRQL